MNKPREGGGRPPGRREPAGGGGRPRRPGRPGGPGQAPRGERFSGGVQSGIGENWWTARWLAALERLGWSVRLQRGPGSTRASNVLRIDVQPGQVTAAVKGSQPKPYRVTIRVEPLTDLEWERVLEALASQALFAARLLAGEMPPTIEDAFAQAGVTLFPTSAKDLYASCSCPNWSNPCKHVAAVHFTLGAEFDKDPFLLFWLRGRSRQQIIDGLRTRRNSNNGSSAEAASAEEEATTAAPTLPPLSECLDTFWQAGPSLIGEQPSVTRPEVAESVLRRLGPPPFWRGDYDVIGVLVDAYRTISREALALAHPEQPVDRPALPPPPPPRPPDRPAIALPQSSQSAEARQRPANRRRKRPGRPAPPTEGAASSPATGMPAHTAVQPAPLAPQSAPPPGATQASPPPSAEMAGTPSAEVSPTGEAAARRRRWSYRPRRKAKPPSES